MPLAPPQILDGDSAESAFFKAPKNRKNAQNYFLSSQYHIPGIIRQSNPPSDFFPSDPYPQQEDGLVTPKCFKNSDMKYKIW